MSLSTSDCSAIAVALAIKAEITLRINFDEEGHRIRAMPKTLFEDWAIECLVDSVIHACANPTMHLTSFVKTNSVFNAPLKPGAGVQDLDVNFASFRPYVVDPDYIGDNVGFNKILQRLVRMAKSEAMADRYLVVNVDQNIYARAIKVCLVSGYESLLLCTYLNGPIAV